jgi:glucose-6-phosphate isomerase
MTNPTTTAAWQTLATLNSASSPKNSAIGLIEAAGITADFSRQSVTADVHSALGRLADDMQLAHKARALVAGKIINPTESRPVLHTLLRAKDGGTHPDHSANIQNELIRIEAFVSAVRAGARGARSVSDKAYTDVVVIGIGGSALGPALAVTALKRFHDGPRIHFVSNIDSAAIADTLITLSAATTLVIVISKTFTTEETNINAAIAREWLANELGAESFPAQFVAVTANPPEAARQGYLPAQTFVFWDGVGGRYSMWSAVGLPIALASGYAQFAEMLAGAAAMDNHFAKAPFSENLPMQLAAVGLWNRNFQGISTHAVLPYSERLGLLAKHLQQLEMESNGKSVDLAGNPVNYATCPVLFGEAGTNGQHSFYQLLHQGVDTISSDIIILREQESRAFKGSADQHQRLNTNAIAQAEAFWQGYNAPDVSAHKVHPGRRPVTLLELTRLDAHHLGALVALYENKVFCQGVLWNINSFDQWGVELGKKIARGLLPQIQALTDGKPLVSQLSSLKSTL